MAFSIKNDDADELLRELTSLTGESLTAAVTASLRERLDRERRRRAIGDDPLDAAIARFRITVTDTEPIDAAVAYDPHGLPT